MKYQDPALRRALAAEYALGTLAGRARRRFETLLRDDKGLQRDVAAWEQRLSHLLPHLPPIKPRPQVWVRIAQAISPAATAANRPPPAAAPAAPATSPIAAPTSERVVVKPMAQPSKINSTPAANQRRFWQAWAGLATAAALVLAVGLFARRAPQPIAVLQPVAPSYVALLQMPNSTMHWAVSISPNQQRITVAAAGEVPPLDGKSVELWVISEKNGPVAIGLLPTHGTGAMTMPATASSNGGTVKLAVSVEPAGGSPTGKPTGPVVIVTEAVQAA